MAQKVNLPAKEIIEKFGGIRPMASKMDVPVTTVQGWKKRNAIPAGRKAALLKAAEDNNIDLSDYLGTRTARPAEKSETVKADEPRMEPAEESASHTIHAAPVTPPQSRDKAAHDVSSSNDISTENEKFLKELQQVQSMIITKSILYSTIAMIIVLLAIGFIFWPKAEEIKTHSSSITELSNDVEGIKQSQSSLKRMIPDNIEGQIKSLRIKADDLQAQMQTVKQQANEVMAAAGTLTKEFSNLNGTTITQRIAALEQKMNEMGAQSTTLRELMDRVESLQTSAQGKMQLEQSVSHLNSLFSNTDLPFSAPNASLENQDVTDNNAAQEQLANVQGTSTPLGQTLSGVPQTDLKAAAYLIGLGKLRSAFNRDNTPFEDDLALMQKFVGNDNPELQDALVRLTPKAQSGVLTPEGLSKEFKGLAGDIVVASLSGEDVTMQEKAKARFLDVFKVEKDGTLVNGTQTQVKVQQAQVLLDQGDIQGAVKVLETLDGDAAQLSEDWINEAEATMLSQKLQEMLVAQIGEKFPSLFQSGNMPSLNDLQNIPDGFNPGDLKLDQMFETVPDIGNAIDGRRIIRDEDSGMTILK